MKYFIDTEFIENFNKPLFGKNRHFIDLISIGIVCEDGREYYAVSNEFNPKDADDWVKENVIDKIEAQLFQKQSTFAKSHFSFTLKQLLKQFGKSNKQIAHEITMFCNPVNEKEFTPHEFYGYYADYDWVLFCSLFGRMIDLPTGFPMYCIDLKQMLDDFISGRITSYTWWIKNQYERMPIDLKEGLKMIKAHPDYPKQTNEHNALDDAKWNQELYKFINTNVNEYTK